MNVITQNELKNALLYNKYTGVFTWKNTLSKKMKIGDINTKDNKRNTSGRRGISLNKASGKYVSNLSLC